MKPISKSLVGALFVVLAIVSAQAVPFTINPSTPSLLQFTSNSQAQITDTINDHFVGADPTIAYKQDVGSADTGPFAASYSTAFFNSSSDPEDATISFVSGAKITAQELYLLVKDGKHAPYAYFFDISSWDRASQIVLNDFWLGGGAISHVSIYQRGADIPVSNVPDGGATLVLLGLSLCGLVAARRVGVLA